MRHGETEENTFEYVILQQQQPQKRDRERETTQRNTLERVDQKILHSRYSRSLTTHTNRLATSAILRRRERERERQKFCMMKCSLIHDMSQSILPESVHTGSRALESFVEQLHYEENDWKIR